MQSRCSFLILAVLAAITIAEPAPAEAQAIRSCVIQETIDSGGYTYIRCRERGSDIWLAIMQTRLNIGENISFYDSPPMVNFRHKALNRTFPQIIFVPGVAPAGTLRSDAESPAPHEESAPAATSDSLYTGSDDNGTLVFTDDPANAPKTAKLKRITKNVVNETVLENFSATDGKLVAMLEKALNAYCTYDLPGLKAVTTAQYWPIVREELEKEGGDNGATFLRTFCFSAFRVETVKHFSEKSRFDGLTYPFADMQFVASRVATNGDEEGEITCSALFIKEKKGWTYIDVLCGASRVANP
jgi:hypothetical protein